MLQLCCFDGFNLGLCEGKQLCYYEEHCDQEPVVIQAGSLQAGKLGVAQLLQGSLAKDAKGDVNERSQLL